MSSLGWSLIQYDYVLIKRRNLDTKTGRRWRLCEYWNYVATRQWMQKNARRLPEARRETWDRFIFTAFWRNQACQLTPWFWTFSLQNCETKTFCCLSLPVSGTFYGRPKKLMHCLNRGWSTSVYSTVLWVYTLGKNAVDADS